jgi:alpha-L-fucosidase
MFVTDGYAWQMGQQAVSYQRIREHVKSLQPDIVMIDHGGLSVPWLGDAIYFEEPLGITAPAGNTYAATQGQTISNGWFWHPTTPTESLMSKDAILSHLADLEPKYTSFILNCPPNRNGRLDTNIVNRLAEVGAAWSPNTSRPPLPTQILRAEHPVTPVSAYATGFRTGEGPLHAIDGLSDRNYETCWSTWGLPSPLPHSITIDLGGVWSNVSTLEYLPKQWNRSNTTDGDITSYTISTSTDGTNFTQVATGTWAGNRATKVAEWPARNVGFVRIQANAATAGRLPRRPPVSPLNVNNASCRLPDRSPWSAARQVRRRAPAVHQPHHHPHPDCQRCGRQPARFGAAWSSVDGLVGIHPINDAYS